MGAVAIATLLIKADMRGVTFVVKTVPNVSYSSDQRWQSGTAWVPSFTYAYTYEGKEYVSSWSPNEKSLTGDAFELITHFNEKAPTDTFVAYWKKKISTDSVYASVDKSNPHESQLTLGELSVKEKSILNIIGIVISVVVILGFIYFMII